MFSTAGKQEVRTALHALLLVHEHAVHIGQIYPSVGDNYRNLGQFGTDQLFHKAVLVGGSHEDHAVHVPGSQKADIFFFGGIGGTGVQDDAGIAPGSECLLEGVGNQRVVNVPDILQQDADQPCLAGGEAACGLVRNVVIFLKEVLDLFSGLFPDPRFPVNDTGDRTRGNAGFFSYIIDRHKSSSGMDSEAAGTSDRNSLSPSTIGCNMIAYICNIINKNC